MTNPITSTAPEYWKIERTNFPCRYIIQYSYDEKEWNTLQDEVKNYPLYFRDFESSKSYLHRIIELNSSDALRKWVQ